jgi:FAD/FMN-containing dehydrogenase
MIPFIPRIALAAPFRRARPGDAEWPSPVRWRDLGRSLGGRLAPGASPLTVCASDRTGKACHDALMGLRNPYYIGDQPGLTQIAGWTHAWSSSPSAYVASVRTAADVARCVNFARENRLRLVVKGGGHSYQGTSSSADSLLVWTRAMNRVGLRDESVTVGPGAVWMNVYDAVTTRSGRYVQGGGCATVGAAGLVQSGGFGSFSKTFGTACAGLLEAEIVVADGRVLVVDATRDPDLFWAIKGGGGGSFGVVTSLTLRTHEAPNILGDVSVAIKAETDGAYAGLIARFLRFYRDRLFNPHWGESVTFHRNNVFEANMVFANLTKAAAADLWSPFLAEIAANPELSLARPFFIEALPGRRWWDADYLRKFSPGSVFVDDRPGVPSSQAWWQGDSGDIERFIHGYQSTWLPALLLTDAALDSLAAALSRGSRSWSISLHFNKGLAGAQADVIASARDTAMNPAATDAFALAIVSAGDRAVVDRGVLKDAMPARAAQDGRSVAQASAALRALVPQPASYLSESDFFESQWQLAFWGSNYARLREIKDRYDPHGLFFVHHGVGSEDWSADGFVRTRSS